jgi:hypothetical protein
MHNVNAMVKRILWSQQLFETLARKYLQKVLYNAEELQTEHTLVKKESHSQNVVVE